MSPEETDLSRRHMLAVLGTGAVSSTAGCSGDSDDDEKEDGEDTSQNGDDSPTPENEPPEILDYDVEPTDFGTRLLVSLAGEDTQGIERAAISYGDLRIAETPEDTSVSVKGELADIHEADPEETPGAVVFSLEDVEAEITEETQQPHTGSPAVSVEPASTSNSGELDVAIEATDRIGLHWIQVEVNGESVEDIDITGSDETGQKLRFSGDTTADGEMNEVTATVENTFGSTQSTTQNQYVREYSVLDEREFDVGVWYLPFFDDPNRWEECAPEGEPEVGRYEHGDQKVVSQHVDQMQGHGISPLIYELAVPEGPEPFLPRLDEQVPTSIDIEVSWDFIDSMRWRGGRTRREHLDAMMEMIHEEFLSREFANRIDGRPSLSIWGAGGVPHPGVATEFEEWVLTEFGSFREFAQYKREKLTVDGTEPFLIGGFGRLGEAYAAGHAGEQEIEYATEFDAAMSWMGKLIPEETVSVEERFDIVEENFRGYAELHDDYGLEFVPCVFPGFDDRHNENCWGDNRVTPRDPDHFERMFELAEEYMTVDRISVGTWNDWPEGTVIEPGTFRDEAFGTDYLEVVKDRVTREN